MKLLPSVHSLPELSGVSKEDKKRALKACQFAPFKNWKVLLSFLLLPFATVAARATSSMIEFLAGIHSSIGAIAIFFAAQIVYVVIALAIFLRVYMPVISVALQNYFAKKETSRTC